MEDETLVSFPDKLADGFGDYETLLNSRDWLEKALIAKGARIAHF